MERAFGTLVSLALVFTFSCTVYGGWLSDAADVAQGAVADVGDTISGNPSEILNKVTSSVGSTATALKDVKISGMTFDQDSGTIAIKGSLDIPGIASPCTIDVTYNPVTSMYGGDLTTADGHHVGFDPQKVMGQSIDEEMEHGLEWIPNFGAAERVIECDYDDVFSQLETTYGHGNVYLASEQFVRWASPSTLGRGVVIAYLGGGDKLANSVQDHAQAEASKIEDWLKSKAVSQVQMILTDILSGKSPTDDLPQLSLRWQEIDYKSHLKILKQDINASTVAEPHAGFAIIWEPTGGSLTFTPAKNNGTFTTRDPDQTPLDMKWMLGVKEEYTTSGCKLVKVVNSSPADKAGLVPGDYITKVDGSPVGDIGEKHWVLWRFINAVAPPGTVNLDILKNGTTPKTITVKLKQLP